MDNLHFYSNPTGYTWKPAFICIMFILAFTIPVFAQNDPAADFTADQTSGCPGLVVIFTDQSIDATSWDWSFPGGTPSSASTQGPHQVTYSNPGSFDVSLEVSNQYGSNKKVKPEYIVIDDCSPVADFSVSPSGGCCPLTVTYTDQSVDATTWNWSFPGGSPSSAQGQGPHIVTYTSPGSYEATLVVANQYGQDTEVKNDVVTVSMCYDFGDAPSPYPTTFQQNGARHTVVEGLYLGQRVDREADGQPDSTATGDDNDGFDDEDGVEWLNELVPGDTTRVIVTASEGGYLKAWIDFNRDGDWEDEGEEVIDSQVAEGANELEIFVPDDAVEGNTYARFRYSDEIIPSYDGEINGGEVEDMRVYLENFHFYDYGDAPDNDLWHYKTLLEHNGARHPVSDAIYLGDLFDESSPPDIEADGQLGSNYTNGDDENGIDDEEGIRLLQPFAAGYTAHLEISFHGNGTLHGWFDWNHDNDWLDAGEHAIVYDNTEGTLIKEILVTVPESAYRGTLIARYRYSTDPVLPPYGRGSAGEVEDHSYIILDYFDYGDAPESYGTLRPGGASHPVHMDVHLGEWAQTDRDGHPSDDALGDDNYLGDDEDGVVFSSLIPGEDASIQIEAYGEAVYLHGWIDYNQNGVFEDAEGEKILGLLDSFNGTSTYTIHIPGFAHLGPTYARFRFTRDPDPGPNGASSYVGEVEDYRVFIGEGLFDYGDAPDDDTFHYHTLFSNNGARHTILGSVFLGQGIDDETDGQPDSTATGDDNDGFDDEDGVEWLNELVMGDTTRVRVTASTGGFLKAWIDFNRDGDWEDEGEEVIDSQVAEGANELEVFVPDDAVEGPTYTRIRYSGNAIPSYDGEVSTGEVEDMRVFIQPRRLFDYGDAPDDDTFHYHTLFSNDGARHPSDASLFLGKSADGPPDMELDGKQSADALGDNNDGDNDENGVIIANHSVPGEVTLIEVWLTGEGYLHGWVDFNCDGDFTDIDEYCIQYDNTSPSMASLHNLSWVTPETAVPGTTYARFRYCTDPVPFRSDGRGGFGEVEDYQIEILPLKNDYGDAPDYYNTTGFEAACHPVSPTVRLGTYCDPDSADQPSVKADGDDTDMDGDDEDGVVFSELIPGNTATITVTTHGFGFLHAWIDYNHDGDWDDLGEYIIRSDPKSDETTDYTINVPINASIGYTYARFRYRSRPESQLTSPDMDTFGEQLPGEVEDYRIHIGQMLVDFGDAPPPFKTMLQDDGARHIIDPDVYLGSGVSAEADGRPDSLASGDDDDGVTFLNDWVIGDTARFEIATSVDGYIGIWYASSEHLDEIIVEEDFEYQASENVKVKLFKGGKTTVKVSTSKFYEAGDYWMRIRFSTDSSFSHFGEAPDGEVEDYLITIADSKSDVNINHSSKIPKEYALKQNFPNPFNPETSIEYDIPVRSIIKLTIFDVLGHSIKTWEIAEQTAGSHKIVWNGLDRNGAQVSAGIYIYYIDATPITSEDTPFHARKKMIYLK